jgi:phospholipase C
MSDQDGHAAYSDPLDEQRFLVTEINALQRTPDWHSTAVVIAYADSDGRYDHVYSGRQPLLVISPWARSDHVDHVLTDQSSILTFVEDNGLGGRRIAGSFDRIAGRLDGLLDFRHAGAGALRLDPVTGAPVGSGDDDARHSTAHRPGGR